MGTTLSQSNDNDMTSLKGNLWVKKNAMNKAPSAAAGLLLLLLLVPLLLMQSPLLSRRLLKGCSICPITRAKAPKAIYQVATMGTPNASKEQSSKEWVKEESEVLFFCLCYQLHNLF
jgi:hypothetical protein